MMQGYVPQSHQEERGAEGRGDATSSSSEINSSSSSPKSFASSQEEYNGEDDELLLQHRHQSPEGGGGGGGDEEREVLFSRTSKKYEDNGPTSPPVMMAPAAGGPKTQNNTTEFDSMASLLLDDHDEDGDGDDQQTQHRHRPAADSRPVFLEDDGSDEEDSGMVLVESPRLRGHQLEKKNAQNPRSASAITSDDDFELMDYDDAELEMPPKTAHHHHHTPHLPHPQGRRDDDEDATSSLAQQQRNTKGGPTTSAVDHPLQHVNTKHVPHVSNNSAFGVSATTATINQNNEGDDNNTGNATSSSGGLDHVVQHLTPQQLFAQSHELLDRLKTAQQIRLSVPRVRISANQPGDRNEKWESHPCRLLITATDIFFEDTSRRFQSEKQQQQQFYATANQQQQMFSTYGAQQVPHTAATAAAMGMVACGHGGGPPSSSAVPPSALGPIKYQQHGGLIFVDGLASIPRSSIREITTFGRPIHHGISASTAAFGLVVSTRSFQQLFIQLGGAPKAYEMVSLELQQRCTTTTAAATTALPPAFSPPTSGPSSLNVADHTSNKPQTNSLATNIVNFMSGPFLLPPSSSGNNLASDDDASPTSSISGVASPTTGQQGGFGANNMPAPEPVFIHHLRTRHPLQWVLSALGSDLLCACPPAAHGGGGGGGSSSSCWLDGHNAGSIITGSPTSSTNFSLLHQHHLHHQASLAWSAGALSHVIASHPKITNRKFKQSEYFTCDLREEFQRQGINSHWRMTSVNHDFSMCNTYPNLLCIPSTISDDVLRNAAQTRCKNRVQALSYFHRHTGTAIVRCAQPLTGEQFFSCIFASAGTDMSNAIRKTSCNGNLVVFDLRPFKNAVANCLSGGSYQGTSENVDVRFCGIENIHKVRAAYEQLYKVVFPHAKTVLDQFYTGTGANPASGGGSSSTVGGASADGGGRSSRSGGVGAGSVCGSPGVLYTTAGVAAAAASTNSGSGTVVSGHHTDPNNNDASSPTTAVGSQLTYNPVTLGTFGPLSAANGGAPSEVMKALHSTRWLDYSYSLLTTAVDVARVVSGHASLDRPAPATQLGLGNGIITASSHGASGTRDPSPVGSGGNGNGPAMGHSSSWNDVAALANSQNFTTGGGKLPRAPSLASTDSAGMAHSPIAAAPQSYHHQPGVAFPTVAAEMRAAKNVIVHCSDGWDRTAQVCALSQMLLDPFFRTVEGFVTLIEKEFVMFGHNFRRRADMAILGVSDQSCPIFMLFLDAVYQLTKIYPSSFEFSEQFLQFLLSVVHGGFVGIFLHNSLRDLLAAEEQAPSMSLRELVAAVFNYSATLPTAGDNDGSSGGPNPWLNAEYVPIGLTNSGVHSPTNSSGGGGGNSNFVSLLIDPISPLHTSLWFSFFCRNTPGPLTAPQPRAYYVSTSATAHAASQSKPAVGPKFMTPRAVRQSGHASTTQQHRGQHPTSPGTVPATPPGWTNLSLSVRSSPAATVKQQHSTARPGGYFSANRNQQYQSQQHHQQPSGTTMCPPPQLDLGGNSTEPSSRTSPNVMGGAEHNGGGGGLMGHPQTSASKDDLFGMMMLHSSSSNNGGGGRMASSSHYRGGQQHQHQGNLPPRGRSFGDEISPDLPSDDNQQYGCFPAATATGGGGGGSAGGSLVGTPHQPPPPAVLSSHFPATPMQMRPSSLAASQQHQQHTMPDVLSTDDMTSVLPHSHGNGNNNGHATVVTPPSPARAPVPVTTSTPPPSFAATQPHRQQPHEGVASTATPARNSTQSAEASKCSAGPSVLGGFDDDW